ncbi:hypothetical protein OAU26_06915 [Mariniblastus sp.]|nr:hypothetical protein [Mariniblastus sp.]
MKRNTFLILFSIFSIFSLAMVSQTQAQTRLHNDPQEDAYMEIDGILGDALLVNLEQTEGTIDLSEIFGVNETVQDFMTAPWLGGIAVGTPADEFTHAGDDKIQECADDHCEVLFAGFNFMYVMPGVSVLNGFAAACYQLRLEGMSENEPDSEIGIGMGSGGVIDRENL